jgi:IS6 family transposase
MGATIDFLLSAFRDADAAKRLFRKALGDRSHSQPRVINTDLASIYSSAIPDAKKEGTPRTRCRHRPVQYLNNILEQDHRAIKRRVNAKQGFREFQAARRQTCLHLKPATLPGIPLPFKGEFEVVIMITDVIEEMVESD